MLVETFSSCTSYGMIVIYFSYTVNTLKGGVQFMLNRYETGSTLVADKQVFNIRIDTELHADLKAMAAEQGRTLHNLVIYILRTAVEQWKRTRDHE